MQKMLSLVASAGCVLGFAGLCACGGLKDGVPFTAILPLLVASVAAMVGGGWLLTRLED